MSGGWRALRLEKTELVLAQLLDNLRGPHLRPFIPGGVEGGLPGAPVIKVRFETEAAAASAHVLLSRVIQYSQGQVQSWSRGLGVC